MPITDEIAKPLRVLITNGGPLVWRDHWVNVDRTTDSGLFDKDEEGTYFVRHTPSRIQIASSGSSLPFLDKGEVGEIVAETLFEVNSWPRTILLWASLLKRGGTLLVKTPNVREIGRSGGEAEVNHLLYSGAVCWASPDTVLANIPAELLRCEYVHPVGFTYHLMFRKK